MAVAEIAGAADDDEQEEEDDELRLRRGGLFLLSLHCVGRSPIYRLLAGPLRRCLERDLDLGSLVAELHDRIRRHGSRLVADPLAVDESAVAAPEVLD